MQPEKTKVVHFRAVNKPMTDFKCICCNAPIAIVDSYIYLGLYLNEHLDVKQIVKSIAKAAH